MNKWSDLLARDTLSESLLDELKQQLGDALDPDSLAELEAAVNKKPDATRKKRLLKSFKKHLTTELYEEAVEELQEIGEDIQWKRSPRGKYISTLNDWAQTFHAQVRADSRFDGLLVGGHSKHEVVLVAGKAKSQEDLDALLALIKKHNPPWKLMVDVEITSQ